MACRRRRGAHGVAAARLPGTARARIAPHDGSVSARAIRCNGPALVHEAYLRLVDQRNVDWQTARSSSPSPRRDAAGSSWTTAGDFSRRNAGVHHRDGGLRKAERLTEDLTGEPWASARSDDVDLEHRRGLSATARPRIDTRRARVVELRFFGGLTSRGARRNPRTSRRPRWSVTGACARLAVRRELGESSLVTPDRWTPHRGACSTRRAAPCGAGTRRVLLDEACGGDPAAAAPKSSGSSRTPTPVHVLHRPAADYVTRALPDARHGALDRPPARRLRDRRAHRRGRHGRGLPRAPVDASTRRSRSSSSGRASRDFVLQRLRAERQILRNSITPTSRG